MELSGTLTLDDGEKVEFCIGNDFAVTRWGNTTTNLGRAVGVTEAFARALFAEAHGG